MTPVAIVTGACSGIGLAMSKELIHRGYKVFMGDINPRGGEVVDALTPSSEAAPPPTFVCGNVASFEDQYALFEAAYAFAQHIDVFLANAGVDDREDLLAEPTDSAAFTAKPAPYDATTTEINLGAVLQGFKLMVHYSRRAQYDAKAAGLASPPLSRMVVTSSTFGLYPFPTNPVYSATKHATRGLVQSLGRRAQQEANMTLNAILPAFVPTGLAPEGLVAKIRDRGYLTSMETVVKALGLFLSETAELPDYVQRIEVPAATAGDGPLTGECAEVSMTEIYLRGSVPFANDSQRWFSEDPDEQDGAGQWPPLVVYDDWPSALQPYKSIYHEVIPQLSCSNPLLDDDTLIIRRESFRSRMRELLNERIDLREVERLLNAAEAGNWTSLRREQLNGVYCTVAVLRHAYRWATIPIVKVAQAETVVDFPVQLDSPWAPLQRHFGCAAESGNNTANVLYNFNVDGNRIFKINIGQSDEIESSEEAFFRMFYDIEKLARTAYIDMVDAIVAFEQKRKADSLRHLQKLKPQLDEIYQIFYDGLVDAKVSRKVWLSYCQGFQGWGVGRFVDGRHVKYDGLSGNHVLIFQAIDAFFGMERYLIDENMVRYIPVRQREFTSVLRRHSIRAQIEKGQDEEIRAELSKLVHITRVFRAAHRMRVVPYLRQPAPERLIMTAGKSVLENQDTNGLEDALAPLNKMMTTRLQETV
ncbi:15-hydroxyprostaglandin dehydrogenase (NAD(+)) [Beauveria bassiana ARSEF 2860]|uniref:15-hydroxyprostaglandin dehydrogenase (NAD(+)) n=1 Tax=Beauveria bassiana (strain ARSEF 2860) TaxID=655819 RepID=J5K8L7_BEAB2|nr:15-hydroxyprostaglandin dehydrogenase (NAD(+)) [Beauveria bassiana ARSEF 2860]EJP70461.1 15-hydroxyprostaglandin dehydrogenase (NAD(+)) [Beauveria bassiana ARSEF 2860]